MNTAFRTAVIAAVVIVGSAATVAAAVYLSPVLAVIAAAATVGALIGVGEWLANRPFTAQPEPPAEPAQPAPAAEIVEVVVAPRPILDPPYADPLLATAQDVGVYVPRHSKTLREADTTTLPAVQP